MAIFRGNLRNPAKTNEGACAILYYKEIFPKYEKSNDILQKGMKKMQFAAYLGHHRGAYNCCFYIASFGGEHIQIKCISVSYRYIST